MKQSLRQHRRAAIAVETALVLCFFMAPLLALAVDAGRALMLHYQMNRALHAALIYAWGVAAAPTADVIQAAQEGYGAQVPAMTATASYGTLCIPPTGTRLAGIAVPLTGLCTGTLVLGTWLTATTSASITPIFPASWGAGAWTISATATVRVK